MTKTLREGAPGRTPVGPRTAAENESQSQHTPGPWHVKGSQITAYKPGSRDGQVICELPARFAHHVDHGTPETQRRFAEDAANARLIAAAPDLLDIARTIVLLCDSGNVEHAQLACMETSPLVDAAREAIAKVEGK